MYRCTTLVISTLLIVISAGSAAAQTTFERVRAQMAEVHSRMDADGKVHYTKQFERWQWFWKARLTPEGDFGTAEMYLRALQDVQRAQAKIRAEADVQAVPTWTELGPEAPDPPDSTYIWYGIGRVNTVAIHPTQTDVMFLGAAQGGIWRTTNGGGFWNRVAVPELPTFGVSDIQIAPTNPSVVYVATGDADGAHPGFREVYAGYSYGVIKSTDGGSTWTRTGLSLNPAQNSVIARLWVDPRDEDIVVAATSAGLYKSTDGGVTWSLKTLELPFCDLIGNPESHDVLYASTFQLSSGGAAIYRSTNAGETWEEVRRLPEANRIRLAVTQADPAVVGAVASDSRTNGLEGVYKSTDHGASFTDLQVDVNLLGRVAAGTDTIGQGSYDLAMAISPTSANLWFVGGINVWRSTNAGSSWLLSAHWSGDGGAPWLHADHHFMTYHPTSGRLISCHDGGIARSTDDGVTWRDMSTGLKIQQYYGLAVSDKMPNATLAGSQDNGTVATRDGKHFLLYMLGDGGM
ncbi:MAG: YCF48-related protein, partial [Candidatus Kapaibacteriota bacterium]